MIERSYEEVPDERLRVGDCVEVIGLWARIVQIKRYEGPIEFVMGVAILDRGNAFSLCRGQFTKRKK